MRIFFISLLKIHLNYVHFIICITCFHTNAINNVDFIEILGVPSAPEKLHYTERTKNTITLTWEPPRSDGGSPIIGFYVEKMRQDSNEFDVANRQLCKDLTITLENLSENMMYDFRVKAVNDVGDGEPSKPISVNIQEDERMYHFI